MVNVFVLGTGRCGTTTFAAACSHFTNYTAGHETLSGRIGDERFAYPGNHIEADNRLSWLLGGLAVRFDGADVLYVHLRRRRADVLDSFVERWQSTHRASILQAFGYGIIQRSDDWDDGEIERLCAFYIDTVTDNIKEFLLHRPSVELWLETLPDSFPAFLDRVDARGDLDAATAELQVRHNQR